MVCCGVLWCVVVVVVVVVVVCRGQPSAGQPSAGLPKISLFFFPPPVTIFILLSLSWGPFVGILVVFLKAGALKCARLGSRVVV